MEFNHCWPDKNTVLRHCTNTWSDYITNPTLRKNLFFLLLPLLVLFLFALSQAGTSLFLLTRFGFSHPVAFLFASMVCICLTSVYFQKISVNFAKSFYHKHEYYKSYKDLYRSFNSIGEEARTIDHFEKIKIMWMLLQHRHLMKAYMAKSDDKETKQWFDENVQKAQHNLGGKNFKLKMYDESGQNICAWSYQRILLEQDLKKMLREHSVTDNKAIKKIRSTLSLCHWIDLEGHSINEDKMILLLSQITSKVPRSAWLKYLKKIKSCEQQFIKAIAPHKDNQIWYEKIQYQRINIDHKLNPDPDLFYPAKILSIFGGLGNMIVGNNLLGLYGSIAGVAALISFYPILHLSVAVKILIASFGCMSAAFASYALTWPMLAKLLKQFTRWRMRCKARSLLGDQNKYQWLTVRAIDWRIIVCFIFAGVVTISAVNFNMYATWHLTNRLIALFPGTWLAKYLTHMPLFIKVVLTSFQCIISFLCAGSLYMTSCFNQYVGHTGKTKIRFISVVDKILKHIKQRSWLKVSQLVLIVVSSLLAAVAQTIIWFHGVTSSPILLFVLAFPASLAFFATFCEAALACLDSDSANFKWASEKFVRTVNATPSDALEDCSLIEEVDGFKCKDEVPRILRRAGGITSVGPGGE